MREIENHNQYYNCWNSNDVVALPGENFILNVRYDNIKILEPQNRIDITAVYPELNLTWRRLRCLYDISPEIIALIDNL